MRNSNKKKKNSKIGVNGDTAHRSSKRKRNLESDANWTRHVLKLSSKKYPPRRPSKVDVFLGIYNSLSQDIRYKLNILGLSENPISEIAFISVSSISILEWRPIKQDLISKNILMENNPFGKYKFLYFDRDILSYFKQFNQVNFPEPILTNFNDYYYKISDILYRNSGNKYIKLFVQHELKNIRKSIFILSNSENDRNIVGSFIDNMSSLRKDLVDFDDYILSITKMAQFKMTKEIKESINSGIKITGVYYDDESFWVIFEGEIIETVLNASDGWLTIERKRKAKALE